MLLKKDPKMFPIAMAATDIAIDNKPIPINFNASISIIKVV
jgi:hypothetical protein